MPSHQSLMGMGDFQKIRSLGVGATAEVFECVNLKTQSPVALKVFNPIVLSDPDALERLRGEIEALTRLQHSNVVRLLGQHREADFFGLELEIVRGGDLRSWNSNYNVILVEPKLWILVQIAKGLGAAHEMEILHRDLKPENVLVSRDGEVKITDFGLARQLDRLTITRLGLLTGSLGYMAPELINGGRPTSRSDMFSFGVMAYELLANEAPFSGETPQALLKSLIDSQEVPIHLKNPAVPLEISALIGRCLNKNPDRRPQSIWAVEAELLTYLSGTRLLPVCKTLVSPASRSTAVREAMLAKNRALRQRIGEFQGQNRLDAEDKRNLIALAQEMKALFPEDEGLPAVFKRLGRNNGPFNFAKPVAFAATTVIMAVSLGLFALHEKRILKPVPEAPVARIAVVTKKLASSPAVKAPARKLEAVKKPKGHIRFETDKDVAVFVNDKPVPLSLWNDFKTSPGVKKIKMVKSGFLPIENIITVEPSKTTVVSAQGGR